MAHLPDTLLVLGSVSLTVGAALIYTPAGFIVAGGLLIYAGLKVEVAD